MTNTTDIQFNLELYRTGQYRAFTRFGLKVISREPNCSTMIEDRNGDYFFENHCSEGYRNADKTPHKHDLFMRKVVV